MIASARVRFNLCEIFTGKRSDNEYFSYSARLHRLGKLPRSLAI